MPLTASTLIAALVAAVAAMAGTAVTAVTASRQRRDVWRDHWWRRFTWAIEKALSDEVAESELGITVLLRLIRRNRVDPEDNELAEVVAEQIRMRPAQQEGEPGGQLL